MSIPASLSYTYPAINEIVSANQEQFQQSLPTSGQTFRSDANSLITFNIASLDHFWKTTRSYLSAVIIPRDAAGVPIVNAATAHSSLGLASVINRLIIKVGSAVVEDISNYQQLLAMLYSTATPSRKSLLKVMEGYGDTNTLVGAGGRKLVHALQSSLLASPQTIPLPVITGGVTIELYIANAKDVFTSANVDFFTVEQCRFNYQNIRPDPSYTVKLMSALEQGRALTLSYVKTRAFSNYGSGGTLQQLQLPVGNVSSIQSFAMTFTTESDLADRTKDKALIYSSQGLKSFRLEASGLSLPANRAWTFNNNAAGYDPELLLLGLMSAEGNIYTMDESVGLDMANFESKNFRVFLSFKSGDGENFGDGLSMKAAASPFMTLITEHNGNIPSTTRINTWVWVDSLLLIKKDIIVVTDVF